MTSDPLTVFVGDGRATAVQRQLAGRRVVADRSARVWAFQRHVTPASFDGDAIWIRDLHLAFPSGQTQGTRLVLTQSTYQLQRWLDWLDEHPGVIVIADADRAALHRSAPEAMAGRGPWSRIAMIGADTAAEAAPPRPVDEGSTPADVGRELLARLHDAFRQPDPHARLDVSRAAAEGFPADAAIRLAFASACMELQLLDDADRALQKAVQLAPDWEAPHFELGKLLLRSEDTERAAASFAEASRLMPHFAAALSNLGAALGELDRREEALHALRRALEWDPRGHPVLNNIGAALREGGRLDEAAEAFRQVIAIAPSFVFGYYNLGHTLLLGGDFAAARQSYEEGFERDPQKNPRQACRLAVARAATADADGAMAMLERLAEELPPEVSRDLFDEAESTLGALSAIPGVDADAVRRVLAAIRTYSS